MEASRVFGVDFGSQRCVVAAESGDVVLNELGAMTTATLVAFKGDERLLGEAAVLSASTNPKNTADYLNLLLGKDLAGVQAQLARLPGQRVVFAEDASGRVVAHVDYRAKAGDDSSSGGGAAQFTVEQLVAMLFGKLKAQMQTRAQQAGEQAGEQTDGSDAHVILAVPSAWGDSERRAVKTAASIAGLRRVTVISRDAALARCFHRKHPLVATEGDAEDAARHIVIVDMGHTSTSAAVVKLTADGETVLSSEADVSIGAETLDRRLFEHFQRELRESQGLAIEFHSKEGKRLFQACEKLKKLLSTIGEASVSVENVAQDRDASISLSRDTFERLCASERARVADMVRAAVSSAGVAPDSIASVEIVGGGTRIPFVQAAILDALSSSDAGLIGRMLDSTTAVAVGAAFCRDLIPTEDVGDDAPSAATEELEQWVALEREMQARDADLAAIAHERNEIEAFVYEMRAKRHEAHGELIDADALDPLLVAAEDWIYSEESEFATLTQIRDKRGEIEQQVRAACAPYFSAVAEAQRAFEAQLEAESEKAKAEQGEGEDHDTRKLRKPERMRLVAKNKEEGNELFRGGNYQHAAVRYVKALSHASKFFDLTSDDLAEVHALKLSLYLNLAQCYLKLESWGKAIANCNDALALDGKSVKALYRRAVAFEKEKDLERAQQDVKQALALAPQDKAVLKLDERLALLAKRQLDREKKMWSKAFA